ncbi:DUF7669 domain-containing protein [Aeromicrobium yanjiei]|uniref:Uncharacterized protein n=1 Tax=Aeromicrobium yanjiei TaxID=2662028 RepID=A0A5Q2MJ83_9ACTN|nr:DUF6884 domain-containing protein [Aeromicrobium yanjiei]QGG41799.1 hypothetical protein GEV26_10725 [Aeromicrobium yanjiei]
MDGSWVVKYDRPVWQIMHRCADAMPPVFRYEDVRSWFTTNYPEVNEATIRAHLIGLTDGGRAKHVQFAQRSPVFRRVARGEYAPIPVDERGEDPGPPPVSTSKIKMSGNGAHLHAPSAARRQPPVATGDSAPVPPEAVGDDSDDEDPEVAEESSDDETPAIPDVILLGSVGERVNVPAPAKEVYRDMSFQLGRIDAEQWGREWFVLSAEHGLVAPNEWISPDSRTLADLDPDYRVVWASWVVTRLESLVGCLEGVHVRLDAPNAFAGPLFAGLQEAGAVVSSGDVIPSITHSAPPAPAQEPEEPVASEPEEPVAQEPEEPDLAPVVQIGSASSIAHALADPRRAMPASDLSGLPQSRGLYGWFVDPAGARELNRCLRLPVRAGLIFVGQVGGSSWHSLADPVLNLRDHIERVQLHGLARSSTFRMNLATVLRAHLRMTSLDDDRLTDWMLEHLSVSCWVGAEPGALRELEQQVVDELDPPLNVDRSPATEYRTRLGQMRSGIA